jgi:hypothetical protein
MTQKRKCPNPDDPNLWQIKASVALQHTFYLTVDSRRQQIAASNLEAHCQTIANHQLLGQRLLRHF